MTEIVVALVLLLKAFDSTSRKEAELVLNEFPENELEILSNFLTRARWSIETLEKLAMRVKLTKAPLPDNPEVN